MKQGNKQPYCIESKPVFGRRGRADPPEKKKPQKVEQKPQNKRTAPIQCTQWEAISEKPNE